MSKFKVGDRVFLRRLPGTIIGIKGSGNGCDYLFEHDIPGKGIHNGNGFVLTSGRYGKARNCEWGVATSFVSMSIPKIIITTDGKTTLARLYEDNKVVKRAEAKCAPGDEFKFEVGANLAYNRLMFGTNYHPGEVAFCPQDKPEPNKLYCVKGLGRYLTKGKIYERIEGKIVDDDGDKTGGYVYQSRGFLVPLVNRPAKVGEWVYVTNSGSRLDGSIGEVIAVLSDGDRRIRHIAVWEMFKDENGMDITRIDDRHYLVLDGYQPEPEQPQYYSGKVVCVECPNRVGPYTPGKIYTFKDGFVQDDYGRRHPTPLSIVNPRNEPIRSFDDWQKHTRAKFIELKGENTH